ncbi:MAG: mannose-1-phosphate guanylyltransferase [Nocardioidaceae bacterium]|nr:mannose-1-phosphate guanylyltransferase [Nocardioidaceae bacterium]
MSRVEGLHAIIPAGGAGTRLWPLSTADHPKFLLDLTGAGRTLLQQTYDRLVPLVGAEGIHVVTGAVHGDKVQAQLPELAAGQVVREPSPRDSMPAIGLAAALVAREHPDAVVASFAADHVITDAAAFDDAVTQAAALARDGWVCTIGIAPTEPSVAFGYVEAGDALDVSGAPDGRAVARFVEKPDAGTAADYLATGRFTWNAGMFVSRADVLLEHLGEQQPRLAEGIAEIADAWGSPTQDEVLARVWPTLTKIAIDHAIAEPVAAAGGIATVPGTFGWDDVGDYASLAGLLGAEGTLRVLGDAGRVIDVGSDGLVISTTGRRVAVVGLSDAVVVDTPDAVLVTTLAHAQAVKQAAEAAKTPAPEPKATP